MVWEVTHGIGRQTDAKLWRLAFQYAGRRKPSEIQRELANADQSREIIRRKEMAERTGLEPATPGVTGRYSNQLNYRSR